MRTGETELSGARENEAAALETTGSGFCPRCLNVPYHNQACIEIDEGGESGHIARGKFASMPGLDHCRRRRSRDISPHTPPLPILIPASLLRTYASQHVHQTFRPKLRRVRGSQAGSGKATSSG